MTPGRAKAAPGDARAAAVLLYDGHCGLCSGIVRYILRHDPEGTLRFAPLGGAYARRALASHPGLAAGDSVVWLEGQRAFARSDAALRVAAYLGGWWRVAALARLVPRSVRDAAYAFVARHRGRLRVPRDDHFVPTPAMLTRMIGDDADGGASTAEPVGLET
ncbi:MAG: DCC1-like thiol-disulfide oxidoreductase family protein [Gemmatimonadota bacterium]|nr:DCC1-like thiol-disulfide oxidoreductase family protein [Gemmatimonadota bacterium]